MGYTHSVPRVWNSATPSFTRMLRLRTPAVRSILSHTGSCFSVINPEYSAFFLGRAEKRGRGYEPYTIYAGTNSDLLTVTDTNTSTEAQLAGCANTSFVPFTWNYTLPSPTLEQLDSAGGKTAFIIIPNITAQEPFGTEYVDTQWGMGLAYSYTAPGEIESPTR